MGDGKHLLEYGKKVMNVDYQKWIALQAIHSAVHSAQIGLKYTWFGSGYLSNMFFRMIANKPMYKMQNVMGDLSLTTCTDCTTNTTSCVNEKQGTILTNRNIAVGDPQGNPIPMTGWRASCMYVWNTTEGGPCVLRPIDPVCPDAPHWLDSETTLSSECWTYNAAITDEPIFDPTYGQNACPQGYFNSSTTETGYTFNLLMGG